MYPNSIKLTKNKVKCVQITTIFLKVWKNVPEYIFGRNLPKFQEGEGESGVTN